MLVLIAGMRKSCMIVVSYMMIMRCAVPVPGILSEIQCLVRFLTVLIRSVAAPCVVFLGGGICGMDFCGITYERGGGRGTSACTFVIRLRLADTCSRGRTLDRAFKFHTCTLVIIYHSS